MIYKANFLDDQDTECLFEIKNTGEDSFLIHFETRDDPKSPKYFNITFDERALIEMIRAFKLAYEDNLNNYSIITF